MSIYWDTKKTLSYNCLFNFIIGARGAGKTFGSLKYAIEQFKKNSTPEKPWHFMYVRRFSTELEKLTKQRGGRLLNAIAAENLFPEDTFRCESNVIYCNDEIMGYAQPLTTAGILKSDAFPYVKLIIFDEFIIDSRGSYHYLKDEVEKFLELYETIARTRNDVVVLFLSNAVSVANPYFDYFHLDKPRNSNIQRFGESRDILVENCVNAELAEYKKQSRIGQLLKGTDYADYAYDNQWLLDNNDFIGKKTQRSYYYVTLRYKDTMLGIWFDELQYRFFVSEDVDPSCKKIYSATTDDHKPNVMLFARGKKIPFLKNIIDAYECGAVYYESLKLKSWFRDIMRMRS